MRWLVCAATFAFGALPAHAQIKIQDVPLDFAVAAETKLQPFGPYEVAATTASFAMRNIQASINGALPGLNSSAACPKNKPGVTFKNIYLQQTSSDNSPLMIVAEVHVKDCHSSPLYEGDISYSVPLSVPHTNQAITLQAGSSNVVAAGLVLVGLHVPSFILVSTTHRIVDPKISNWVSMINSQIKRGVDSIKRMMATYSVAIQSSKLAYVNGDLVVSMQFSGQVPLATANKWLQNF